jgi:hypothetical protein
LRGTALPDGTPIEATARTTSRRRAAKKLGPFEEAAEGLVAVGRSVDLALARYRLAKPALEQAVGAWRDALQALPHVGTPDSNGN